jgi:hypothetical protein
VHDLDSSEDSFTESESDFSSEESDEVESLSSKNIQTPNINHSDEEDD